MKRHLLFALLVTPFAFGCDPKDETPPADGSGQATDDGSDDDDMGESGPEEPDDSDDEPATTGDDEPDDGDDTDGGVGFISEPDGGGVAIECDVWTNDCPDGEKCMPWANDGGNAWNATRCSSIDPNPGQVGDECTVEGSGVSGIDSCDARTMCYYVDSETNTGTCIGFCEGSASAPSCGQGSICTIVNDGVLTLCRPECDPLLQDCTGNAACLQATGSQGFTCIVDASGEAGQAGDPCEFINACDPGLFCGAAEAVPGCTGATGCCSEFCDMAADDPISACSLGGGQECVSWFEEGNAPPDLVNIGVCAIPQ